MRKITTIILLCILFSNSIQAQRKISSYLSIQYNKTLYDVTFGNNPSGIGMGLETLFNTKTKFKPVIEITGDIYLENDKVFRVTTNGEAIDDVRGMINLFAGLSFYPNQNTFLSLLAGPSFINGYTRLGIKPSMGFYFAKSQKVKAKISYINIFNRNKLFKQDFGTMSFAIAFKLF